VAAPAAGAQGAFPATPLGASSAAQEIVLLNDDPDPVTLGQAGVSGQDAAAFGVVTDACMGQTLAPDEACAVTMSFRPARIGTHAATLHVPVQGEPDAPFTAGLSGEGIQALRLTPSLIDFGTVFAPSRAGRDVLVENVSGREITALFPRIVPSTGAFFLSSTAEPTRCGPGLAAGTSCRLRVRFMPRPGVTAEARLVFGGSGVELGSIPLRGTGVPRPAATPIRFPTPDATPVLRQRLRAALKRLRGRGRAVLLRRGLIVRGILPPAQGRLGLVVRARRGSRAAALVAVRRRLAAPPGQRATIRAHLTRAGRRLLRGRRPLILDVKLTLVARSDDRLSEAKGVLRLGRVATRR
jgi:hypothetical protein